MAAVTAIMVTARQHSYGRLCVQELVMIDSTALARLLQLASPMLPVGAYSYSQGLEWSIEDRTVYDAASAEKWIGDVLEHSLCRFELPVLWRMCHAWQDENHSLIRHWNEVFCAGRKQRSLTPKPCKWDIPCADC